jgi:hypothetical protein
MLETLELLHEYRENSSGGIVFIQHKKPADWLSSTSKFYFRDAKLFRKLKNHMDSGRIAIRLKLKDAAKTIHEDCWALNEEFVSTFGYSENVQLYGLRRFKSYIQLTIPHNSDAQKKLAASTSVNLEVESALNCPKIRYREANM